MAGKRVSFASFADEPVVAKPGREDPHTAALNVIAPNPDNPRDPDELDLDELIASMQEVGQLQPVVVMARSVFCKLRPHHEATISNAARWVVIGGNRRLEAARALGWAELDIKVRDDLGDGDGAIDEAVMVENIQRKDIAPIRQAELLDTMLKRLGSQEKVAKRIGKTQAFVSQRLALLNLAPEIKAAVDAKELTLEKTRRLASIADHDQQVEAWKTIAAAPKAPKKKPAPKAVHNAVMDEEKPQPVAAAVPEPRHSPAPASTTPPAAPALLEPSLALSASMVEAARVLVAADPLAAAKALAQVASSTWLEESSLQMMNIVDDTRTAG